VGVALEIGMGEQEEEEEEEIGVETEGKDVCPFPNLKHLVVGCLQPL